MTSMHVLIVDDDDAFRFAMTKALRRLGYQTSEAASGEAALELLEAPGSKPDVALLDLKMRGISGLEVLRRCGPTATQFIVLTGHGTVQAAVEAMQLGAYSFLEKPVDAEVIKPLVDQAIREAGTGPVTEAGTIPIVGSSAAMDAVRAFVKTVAPTDETITIYGETGTGKEVVARQIHASSRRAAAPFVALNAACVPRELFESELFGHKRGAFTGADADRHGLFREADNGTLFIDELSELPLESQAKLLRALEVKTIRPVGASNEIPVDVRIVAASNHDLWTAAQAGRFRQDLYFRLQVFPVVIPPLRERPEDIKPLTDHLMKRLGRANVSVKSDAFDALRAYAWPGNVRELLNVLRRASLFAGADGIDGELARRMIAASVFGQAAAHSSAGAADTRLAAVEREHIERVLNDLQGNITQAATALGIDRRTLQRKLRAYGIDSDD